MRIKPFFRWYDLWIGVYIDTTNEAIYIIPFPMFGVKISYCKHEWEKYWVEMKAGCFGYIQVYKCKKCNKFKRRWRL